MSTALLTRSTTSTVIPRVNLLPAEVAEAERLKRLKVILAGGVAASVAVVGLLFVVAVGQVSTAQSDLDAATAQTAALQAEVTTLAEVPKVYGQVAAAEKQLATAMGDEVRWSFFLSDLSLTIPNDVGLDSLNITQTRTKPAVPGQPTAQSEGATSVLGTPGIATITYDGQAATQDDVAAFLDALAKQSTFVDPYFTDATVREDSASGRDVVNFAATTTVTDAAKSNRYNTPKAS